MERKDEDLINFYLAGEESALKELIERYTTPIYNYSARFLGEEEAKDVLQDIFIKVWKNLRKFDNQKSSFKTWLFVLARRTIIDRFKKKKALNFSDLDSGENNFIENIEDEILLPDKISEKIEDSRELNLLIDKLPEKYKEILILYYQEDMNLREISEVLNKPLNTVKSYYRRALLKLKELLLHQNYKLDRIY